jgi:hypothetical protein
MCRRCEGIPSTLPYHRTSGKPKSHLKSFNYTKEDEMATAAPILIIQSSDNELAKQTVFIKLHLGLLGNSRKVKTSQVAVDADKALIRVSKTLLDSPELQAIRILDGDIRHFLYGVCLPFEVGIHLLPLGLVETVDERLHEFKYKRGELVGSFLSAYPRLCQETAGRRS